MNIGMKTPNPRQVEKAVASLLSRALNRGVALEARLEEDVLMLRGADLPKPLAVAIARESRRPLVARAAERAREWAGDNGAAVVAAPYMTPAGIDAAERAKANWLDLAGNAHLVLAPALAIQIEGRPPGANRPGRPSSPFAPASSRVSRALLVEPQRSWAQKELTVATGLAQGSVSRALSGLGELGLVRRGDDGRYRSPVPSELLDAWSDEYDYQRHGIVPMHLGGSGIGLVRELVGRLRERAGGYALTGLPAAWLYDGFAQFRTVSVLVEDDPAEIADEVGGRVGERGANVQLVWPNDDGVFYGAREVDGCRCAHPVQVYLDLGGLPERADEAAAQLRRDWLRW
jgi:DNA-binding transcriptional ArsR family regulator